MTCRTLMVQGTASDAGKSVLVAGLCRLAARRGLRVAPFKGQNMSLNAAATWEGHEIGRAQALQAQASGIEATVAMNPILLKPEGEMRSQIVLRGRPIARADFHGYAQYRERCVAAIDESLAELQSSHELVIAEGAGSPAEINLMERDLANMFVARRANADVLLVGDIDRGGVFASFVGTLELLPPADAGRIKGFVVNRFRGDVELLKPGLAMLEDRTGVPTVGVVPFLRDLGLPEEDSYGLKTNNAPGPRPDGVRRVAVVRLPRLSNQDDFLPLEQEPRVQLHYVDDPSGIEGADLVILPGSKATRADLGWLKVSGLADAVERHARNGGATLGICGGYQMLGDWIHDPSGIEGEAGSSAGLGLLPVSTVFRHAKTVRRVQVEVTPDAPDWARAHPAKEPIAGYEIHCGETQPTESAPGRGLFRRVNSAGQPSPAGLDGAHAGSVTGTLVHGAFQSPELRAGLLGLGLGQVSQDDPVEAALDRLADVLERELDPALLSSWL